jgi:hypothetical protein
MNTSESEDTPVVYKQAKASMAKANMAKANMKLAHEFKAQQLRTYSAKDHAKQLSRMFRIAHWLNRSIKGFNKLKLAHGLPELMFFEESPK